MPSRPSTPLLLLLVAALLAMPGCGGCRQETPQERAARIAREEEERQKKREEERKKDKNEKRPPLETKLPLPQPNEADRPAPLIKPGHWMAATQVARSNYEDWVGRAQQQVVDKADQPVAIERTPFSLRTSRDAALVKGQEKALETILFAPNTLDPLRLRTSLIERGGGRPEGGSLSMQRMLPHQYHFVILAAEPERYGFLRNGNYAVDAPISWDIEVPTSGNTLPLSRNYHIAAPVVDKRLPLADNPLCWTTTAYVLWDEVDPERLDAAQREAMIDWLHWGGQLVVSGPDSLDLLGESFLAPYLPADSGGPRDITTDDLTRFARAFQASWRRPPPKLAADGAWSGVRLKLRPEAEPIAEAKTLFAERRVGRGRIVVSAMQLAEREF
ncbi:MAG: hypothetical protein AAF596_09095, partial [Planctomycetota bacterium]